jgi:hypothetical protein
MKKLYIFLGLMILCTLPLFSEDTSMDGLFDDPGLIVEAEETGEKLEETLLKDEEGVRIGGSFFFEASNSMKWDPDTEFESGNMRDAFDIDLQNRLYFDARPETDLRVYGEVHVEYPFSVDESRSFDEILIIEELYTDTTLGGDVFIRTGKQTLNWGVGYFFSPANLLNLTRVDPQNPEEELVGPVSLKVNRPFKENNLYAYAIVPENVQEIEDLSLAAKYEWVVGRSEIGFGSVAHQDQGLSGMTTWTMSIYDFSFFAEGVLQYQWDEGFDANLEESFYPQATLGISYVWEADESERSFSVTGQYYYNGAEGAVPAPAYGGEHYAALRGRFSFTDTLSFEAFWLGGMTDGSGLIEPSLHLDLSEELRISARLPYTYGQAGDEFTPPTGETVGLTLDFSLEGVHF